MAIKRFWKLNRILVYTALILLLGGCSGNPGHQALKRGMRALEKGRYAESISWFQRSLSNISSDDQRSIVFNCIGIAYYKLGQTENALNSFEDAVETNRGAVEPVYNMGIVLFETENADKAILCFEKAALLDEQAGLSTPASSGVGQEARPGSPVTDTRALEFLAVIYSRRQQWDDARRVLNEALQRTHHSPRILTALALVELKANNSAQAVELLQEALEQDAHYAPAIYNLAVVNQEFMHKQDQALPLFAEYTTLVSSGPQAEQARSMIKEMKRLPEPEPAPAKATSAEPVVVPGTTQPPAVVQPVIYPSLEELMQVAGKLEDQGRREAAFNNYLRIARAAEQAGNITVRNQAVKHAVSLAEGNSRLSCDLGIYFLERNRKDEAFIYLKSAVDQEANAQPAALALARLAIEKSDYDTALVSLKKADQIKPDDPEALWLLADLYDRSLFLTNSAASAYSQFTARFPKDRRAADARNRLKIINPENKPVGGSATGRSGNSKSFWQRMFKTSAANQ